MYAWTIPRASLPQGERLLSLILLKICLRLREISWRRKWQSSPVFLPGRSHGQRNLAGYSCWGRRVRHNFTTKQQQRGSLSYCYWATEWKSRGRRALKRWKGTNEIRGPALSRPERRKVLGRTCFPLLLESATLGACLENPETPVGECWCLLLFHHVLGAWYTHTWTLTVL